MTTTAPRGSIVAVATPMGRDGALDWGAFAGLIDFHVKEQTAAIVAAGTTGESPTVTMEENRRLIKIAVEHCAGRIPIIAGTGANATAEAVSLSKFARAAGADYALSVAPYYNRPTQEGMYRHFRAAAEESGIATILYNVPARTASDIADETVLRLAELPLIAGIKDATGDIKRGRELMAAVRQIRPDFAFYSGDDKTAREYILAGGDGVISVTANVAPRLMSEMCAAALAGDEAAARAADDKLAAFHRAQSAESNPIPVKWALAKMGLIPDGIRLPLTPLARQYQDEVTAALDAAGVGFLQ
jgi:4-hydroxy-tetrahydrodipicolinate synthase